ncbi:unnamed protein product [Rhizoctonia solani]|uniref:F-box domain-containing protein n=1 Tax=Rhizoctonia solani TaxID=456999 RepID=A0A8H3E4E4_9AGAM|nr:unnamed protein product [Rhizoctonia solani]
MAKVFEIPELLSLICKQAWRSDLARLLTTSRLFFECALPVIWESPPESAPIILMRLLPDADLYLENPLDTTFAAGLQPLDAQSLARFNFYAPYIKQVARHQRNRQADVVWDRLLRLVDTRPILPQLEVLKFSLSMTKFSLQDPVQFVSVYLCPTLVEIDLTRKPDSIIEPQDLSDLVSSIALHCPHIRSLKLNNITTFLRSFNTSELATSLAQLHDLRVLGLGPIALVPRMTTALSSLPHLESLILNETYHSPNSEDLLKPLDCILPSGFPALQHFGIKPSFDFERAARVWNLSALAQNLTSVSVRIDVEITRIDFRSFVRAICQRSPLITALALDFSDSPNYLGFLVADIIDDLALLPLQYLWLCGRDRGITHWDSEKFALAFPKMERLRIRGYYLTFKDLKFIAMHMPRLRQLSVRVRLNTEWPSKDELSSFALTPSQSRLYFHLQLDKLHPIRGPRMVMEALPNEEVEMLALGLHILWPKGVICEPQQRSDKGGKPSYTDQINTALRGLGKFSEHDAMEVDSHPRKRLPEWFGRL